MTNIKPCSFFSYVSLISSKINTSIKKKYSCIPVLHIRYLQTTFSFLQIISQITENFLMFADIHIVFAGKSMSDIHLKAHYKIYYASIRKGNNMKLCRQI